MELSDVIALARAGYTREEIAALNTTDAPVVAAPAAPVVTAPAAPVVAAPAAPVVAAPAAPIAAEAAPAAPIAAEAAPAWAEALNANIAALTQRVTAMNLCGPIPPQQPQTVDAILAEIIAPQPKK